MSPIREKFIKIIDSLPYDLDKEVLTKNTKEILQDITKLYVDTYGTDDLSANDKECIQLIGISRGSFYKYKKEMKNKVNDSL